MMTVRMRKVRKMKKAMTMMNSVGTDASFNFWVSIIVRHDMYRVHEFCVLLSYNYVFTYNPEFLLSLKVKICSKLMQNQY